MDQVSQRLVEIKTTLFPKKELLFHQENKRVHTYGFALAKFNQMSYEFLPRPPYCPDKAPSSQLFPDLKKWLGGTNKRLLSSYYLEGVKKWEKRRTKCMKFKKDTKPFMSRNLFYSKIRGHMIQSPTLQWDTGE